MLIAIYNQGQLTFIFNTISCGLQSKAANNRVNSAGTQSTTGKSKRDRCESAKTNFTNDDVMKYVIGALQWKLPQDPLPFNRALHGTTFCLRQNNRTPEKNDSLLFHSKLFQPWLRVLQSFDCDYDNNSTVAFGNALITLWCTNLLCLQIRYPNVVTNLGVILVFNELRCWVICIWHGSLSMMLPCAWL